MFEPWFKPRPLKTIRRHLRKLMERCAAVRNCDIAIEVLQAAGCREPKLVASLKKSGGVHARGTSSEARTTGERQAASRMAGASA